MGSRRSTQRSLISCGSFTYINSGCAVSSCRWIKIYANALSNSSRSFREDRDAKKQDCVPFQCECSCTLAAGRSPCSHRHLTSKFSAREVTRWKGIFFSPQIDIPHNRDTTNLGGELHASILALCRSCHNALLEREIAEAYIWRNSERSNNDAPFNKYPLQ